MTRLGSSRRSRTTTRRTLRPTSRPLLRQQSACRVLRPSAKRSSVLGRRPRFTSLRRTIGTISFAIYCCERPTLLLRFTPSTASRTCGPPANATVSLRRRQFDLRHAQGQIRSIESFHAERLQSKALLGAADKHIGAEPDRPGHLCCCPDVSARQVTG